MYKIVLSFYFPFVHVHVLFNVHIILDFSKVFNDLIKIQKIFTK